LLHGLRPITLSALLAVVLPTSAFAASGMITCAVDPFSKDGLDHKQFLTISYDGDGPDSKATLQSPWGTLVYEDALITGSPDAKLGMMMGGEREAELPDFDGMEACLSKAAPDQLHSFATLLGLVSQCGHTLPLGASPVAVQTLFGLSIEGEKADLTMSLSYSADSTVANDYLEFRQAAVCKRVM
jgi:hypothetical protein